MKNGWQHKKLEDVCEFIGGSQPPKSTFSPEKKEGYVRLIQIRDYKSENHIVYIRQDSTKKFCTSTDVMIGRYGPPVFQILKGLTGAYNVALMKAVPDETQITKDYLFSFLQTPKLQEYIISLSERAAGQSGVNKRALNEYPINFPPIPEQKRIVEILDKAFAAIDQAKANAQKNLQNSRELFESYLNKVFAPSASSGQRNPGEDWEEKRLVKVCLKTENIKWKENQHTDFLYIDLKSVSRKSLSIESTQTINSENAPSRAKKIVQTDDIIFGTTRPTLKRVAIIKAEFNGQICSTGFVVLRANHLEIYPKWIYYFLQKSSFIEKMRKIQKGASYPAVTDKEVKFELIPIPPLSLQEDNIKALDSFTKHTKKLETIYKQKLIDLEELKKSILQKAFEGKL